MIGRKLNELYLYVSKKGFKATILRIYSNYFNIKTFVLYKRELREDPANIIFEKEFKCFQSNLELLKEIRNKKDDMPREFYLDKTHRATFFYLTYYKKELACILWIFPKGEYSRFFNIQDEKAVELNYMFTLSSFRGKRLQGKTVDWVCKDLKERGYNKVLLAISSTNISARKGMELTCFREFHRIKSYFSYVKKIKI